MPDFRKIHNVEDLRAAAAAYLPKPVFDFIDGGAEDEVALRNNRSVFERVRFRPRTMADVQVRSIETTLLGKPAGSQDADGNYADGSVFAAVAERFAVWHDAEKDDDEDDKPEEAAAAKALTQAKGN